MLNGKNAVVTGGGRGIGAAVAKALAEAGAGVVVSARSASEIESTAEALREAGGAAWAVAADVSDPEQVTALFEGAVEKAGQIDILVNNAGFATSSRLTRIRLEEWERLFAVNVTGTFLCTQAFLPPMRWASAPSASFISAACTPPSLSTATCLKMNSS